MGIFEEAAIFRGVTKEDARQMLNCLNPVEKTYKKDEIIYHAGDEVTSMGVVLSGSVFIENDDIWHSGPGRKRRDFCRNICSDSEAEADGQCSCGRRGKNFVS